MAHMTNLSHARLVLFTFGSTVLYRYGPSPLPISRYSVTRLSSGAVNYRHGNVLSLSLSLTGFRAGRVKLRCSADVMLYLELPPTTSYFLLPPCGCRSSRRDHHVFPAPNPTHASPVIRPPSLRHRLRERERGNVLSSVRVRARIARSQVDDLHLH
ncbi:hypothetical protein MPTK1_5g06750 [Marchantia polymorpha subsp. ruderalis]|uniref:Uncharacterized protein n=2 Tax=Marchantia polymorpha TaxID=3197 RepID=A0AAF6BFP3_MARPO|nr:hypothetical protein MARPO_0171s0008 [Marchantia polymorpha]PTQ28166.1 hypothetical protein MARPO_0171s0008 [Marchantia polymorpha]BBN10826.1 hypothetical protein Mp_5g06750 [Marchantia polymorpha subsp. ruderalis]BBN10827.1 hypothetical protein Mp_5g06750 [Marchantia polymorpha subsp. ruderalis]|eukprot:PTQ28165.1 hypothetical protein MARPO_0171s0008 [Marchantia polymorpha]